MSSGKSYKEVGIAFYEKVILSIDNNRILSEWYNDEKLVMALLIVVTKLLTYYFW